MIRMVLGLVVLPLAGGCRPTPLAHAAAPPRPQAAAPADYKKMHVNEAGRIPVLMYHAVGGPSVLGGPRYDRRGLNISPETFRKQLRLMYEAGWYPVNMRDAVTAHIDVPAGKIPVVFTFDDARGSQLHYLRDGSLDPSCAVAIMEAFHKEHPDWPLRASFYVMGRSKWNPVPFYQPGTEKKKLEYLVQQGYELANHSTSHRSFSHMSPETIQQELAECVRYVKTRAPGATMDTFALPYGARPAKPAMYKYLIDGSQGGTTYHNLCVLDASGIPAYPPAHKKYDPLRIMRCGSDPGYIESWIKHLKPGAEVKPYISDGDPNTVVVPKAAEKEIDPAKLSGARLVVYDDGSAAKKPAKPTKSKSHAHPSH